MSGAAQQAGFIDSSGKPIVLGARKKPRTASVCLDYGKTRFQDGSPYRIVEPDRTITRHEGVDFCKPAGSPVISPTDGTIRWIEQNNNVYGGVIGINAGFSIRPRPEMKASRVFVEMVHIVPLKGLRRGQRVTAGQLIGHVQDVGPPSIGHDPHVHFAVRWCEDWPRCHIDPNYFWRDGPGIISCANESKPPPVGRIVAPVPC